MALYSIIHNSGALYLNLEGSGAAYVHRPVNLYSSTASVDQQWVIDSFSGTQVIRSQNNTAYGLNYRPSTSKCDIQIVSGKETDAEVVFRAQSDGTHKIELAHHAGLYLTADGTNRTSTVSWKSARSDRSQNWLIWPYANRKPTKHNVFSYEYAGRTLTVFETHATNLKLLNLEGKSNIIDSPYYGANAGYFTGAAQASEPNVLNVAICDGQPVGPKSNDGLGGRWIGGGIIAWNGSNFDVRPVNPGDSYFYGNQATEFLNLGYGTWAQGGYSMYLGLSNWFELMVKENNNIDDDYTFHSSRPRTGFVINRNLNKVYMVTCKVNSTFAEFRTSILAWLGISDGNTLNSVYSGLFLDGGGSTSLKARQNDGVDKLIPTDGRNLYQILALRDNT